MKTTPSSIEVVMTFRTEAERGRFFAEHEDAIFGNGETRLQIQELGFSCKPRMMKERKHQGAWQVVFGCTDVKSL